MKFVWLQYHNMWPGASSLCFEEHITEIIYNCQVLHKNVEVR